MAEDLLLNLRPTVAEAAEGESTPESELEDSIGLYLDKIRNKDSGFSASDITEWDYQELPRVMNFIESELGFFIPERGKILNSPIKIQINLLIALLKLFLNLAPVYYSDDPSKEDIREFYEDVKNTNDTMHEFIRLQPFSVIKDFLTVD